MNEEQLDKNLVRIVMKHGWAENRFLHTARILRIILKEIESKEMRNNFRAVIKYLEDPRLE